MPAFPGPHVVRERVITTVGWWARRGQGGASQPALPWPPDLGMPWAAHGCPELAVLEARIVLSRCDLVCAEVSPTGFASESLRHSDEGQVWLLVSAISP